MGDSGKGNQKFLRHSNSDIERGARRTLVRAACVGVAASLIDGNTSHVAADISPRYTRAIKGEAEKRLQDFWWNVRYLIIGTFFATSGSFLAQLSQKISVDLEGAPGTPQCHSFRGLSVILCGDLHQILPVACAKPEAL